MQLYKLTEQYNAIARMLESDGYEWITKESIQESLKVIKDDIETKITSIAKIVLELKADAAGISSEIDRLKKRKEATENHTEWFKNYLLGEMVATRIDKIKQDVITVSVSNNPPSVEIKAEDLIPIEYWKIIPETKQVDKMSILEHFKNTGEVVAGIEVVLNKKHINIR